MLNVETALAQILATVKPITATETVPLINAMGRVLASQQIATVDVPPADNSAMDGYAVNTDDLNPDGETWLPISQRIAAGEVPKPLLANTVARIFTGAEIPPGANAVIMQEQCATLADIPGQPATPQTVAMGSDTVRLPCTEVGNNIRRRGQDICAGQPLFPQGHKLQAQDIGLLASVGISSVTVQRRLKIAVISTGDELVEPGQTLTPGQIYNSNRYLLAGLLHKLDVDFIDLGIVADSAEATRSALQSAAAQADCVISSGGVSVGEEDHVKAIVEELGELSVWRLALKPGKPLAFGRIGDTPFFGLPGNPVSAFITFVVIVRPYLYRLQGTEFPQLFREKRQTTFAIDNRGNRQEYRRVRINSQGLLESYPNQSSGVLSSVAWANALAVIPPETQVAIGADVDVIPFTHFFL